MLISCKCLNFIATSAQKQKQLPQSPAGSATLPSQQLKEQHENAVAAVVTADNGNILQLSTDANSFNNTSGATLPKDYTSTNSNPIALILMQAFLQKYQRNFIFYSQCMDFFKQAIGPIPDLTINAINQRDLIYSLTLDIASPASTAGMPATASVIQTWQISFCINCNKALCAKWLQTPNIANISCVQSTYYLINSALLTSNDELSQRRADKSFSETFGLLIMDHPQLDALQNGNSTAPTTNLSIVGSFSTHMTPHDTRQQRLRQLQAQHQARLKQEIADTDERIQRFTEQQFALLKSFREKSDQECSLLMRVIKQMPDQATELLDRTLPALEVNGGAVSYAARRRNTLSNSSRRSDVNGSGSAVTPTTPTIAQPPNYLALPQVNVYNGIENQSIAMDTMQIPVTKSNNNASATITTNNNNSSTGTIRKLTHFDTPPATPEATPMSVSNSPTFKQQQQQQMQGATTGLNGQTQQQQLPTSNMDPNDDCLFELDDIDENTSTDTTTPANVMNYTRLILHQLHNPQSQRLHSLQHGLQHNENNMSDVDESDAAEEAEDALDLDSSMPIIMSQPGYRTYSVQALNLVKSLPIEIANSPMTNPPFAGEDFIEELDNTVDIAASIKALAKSVHGEAVFGDLPRPRLRSQI